MKIKKIPALWNKTRAHPRVDIRIPISFSVDRSIDQSVHFIEEGFLHGEADNISLGGVCFHIDAFIPEGTLIILHMRAASFYADRQALNEYIETAARVVYATLNVKAERVEIESQTVYHAYRQYMIGAEFVRLDPQDKKAISEFIKKPGAEDKNAYL